VLGEPRILIEKKTINFLTFCVSNYPTDDLVEIHQAFSLENCKSERKIAEFLTLVNLNPAG
jgi:hypothetical protein